MVSELLDARQTITAQSERMAFCMAFSIAYFHNRCFLLYSVRRVALRRGIPCREAIKLLWNSLGKIAIIPRYDARQIFDSVDSVFAYLDGL